MKELKVAYIGIKGLPARGGAERVVEAIASRMPKFGVTPTVYCDKRYTPPGTSINGGRIIRIPTFAGKHARQFSLNVLAALHAVIFGNYDVIHLQHTEAGFILPILRMRYRVVSTSHGSAYRTKKWGKVVKLLMRMMDWPFVRLSSIATFVSSVDAERFKRKYRRDTVYIPNGVNPDCLADREEARKILASHGITPGNYFLFVAGRIEPIKGAHLAIAALNEVSKDYPLLIVGDTGQVPSYGRDLRDMAEPGIIFHPPISSSHILFGLMAEAKCLVFPSLVEAMSMVLLEAASIGVPIIASDIPENVAVLGDQGVYFMSNDIESLKERVCWALSNQDEMLGNAVDLQKCIIKKHAWDTIAAEYASLYNSL